MNNEICLMISTCVIAICYTTYKIIKEIFKGNKVNELINDIDQLKDRLYYLEERQALKEVEYE